MTAPEPGFGSRPQASAQSAPASEYYASPRIQPELQPQAQRACGRCGTGCVACATCHLPSMCPRCGSCIACGQAARAPRVVMVAGDSRFTVDREIVSPARSVRRSLVRIVATPNGEAPVHVRTAWIGVVVPLASEVAAAQDFTPSGVLTGKRPPLLLRAWAALRGRSMSRGFEVPIVASIDILGQVRPDAARWWRENAPWLFVSGGTWFFDEASCELVTDWELVEESD